MKDYDALPGIQSHMQKPGYHLASVDNDVFNRTAGLDCRVRIVAILLGTVGAFFIQNEIAFGLAAIGCFIWLCAFKRVKMAIVFGLLYGVLFTFTFLPATSPIASFALIANIIRRMSLPAFLAIPLGNAPTGVLIATLNKLRIPRSATIALAVVFRFMPTVATEYGEIRTAQKFRGIGVSPWGLFRHPLQSFETILVPLLIRTTRIADELSASAMLRGADGQTVTTSFRSIRFSRKDTVVLLILLTIAVGIVVLNIILRR